MIQRRFLMAMVVIFIVMCCSSYLYAETQSNQLEQGDAKVLITPYPRAGFTDALDLNGILIKGSWVGDAGRNFVYEGRPIVNAVDIICDKSIGRCIESRAEVSPVSGRLTVESRQYKVIKWVDNEVEAHQTSDPYSVLGHSFGAGKLTLRIDRINKKTTLNGEYETDGKKSIWKAHLDSGEKLMEIYNSKQKKK